MLCFTVHFNDNIPAFLNHVCCPFANNFLVYNFCWFRGLFRVVWDFIKLERARRFTGHLLSKSRTDCTNGVRMQQQMERCFSEVNYLFYCAFKCRWHDIFTIFCYRNLHLHDGYSFLLYSDTIADEQSKNKNSNIIFLSCQTKTILETTLVSNFCTSFDILCVYCLQLFNYFNFIYKT